MKNSIKQEILDKVIDHPIASHALLQLLIEDGVKISINPETISHHDRKIILRQIVDMLEKRETSKLLTPHSIF